MPVPERAGPKEAATAGGEWSPPFQDHKGSRDPGGRLDPKWMGSALHSPFFRTTSSDSGLRLTETTFISRWFPPWRMSETTCLCPTFTTFTPFTCAARRGRKDERRRGALRLLGSHDPSHAL